MSRSPSPIASVTETCQVLSVTLKKPSSRYIDEFIRLKCAPDLLAARVFPNAKEITESMAAFDAVRKYVGAKELGNREWVLVDVGCGATPRTAALFAHRTNWDCLAVDPNLNKQREYHNIDRLALYPRQIEQMKGVLGSGHLPKVVVVAVHAHVRLPAILNVIKADRIVLVAIPCCIGQDLPIPMKREIVDWGIWSPKRVVKVWDLKGGMEG